MKTLLTPTTPRDLTVAAFADFLRLRVADGDASPASV